LPSSKQGVQSDRYQLGSPVLDILEVALAPISSILVAQSEFAMNRDNLIRISRIATVPAIAGLLYGLSKPPDGYFFGAITISLLIAWGLEVALVKLSSKRTSET
jgi:hypothetical protein